MSNTAFQSNSKHSNNLLNNKIYVCGIGAQKSGTTFVAQYLSDHPDFCMSPLKELHHFNTYYKSSYSGTFEKKLLININKMIEKLNKSKPINTEVLFAQIKRIEAVRKNNYFLNFSSFVEQHHIAFGEITPAYSTLSKVEYNEIVKIFPNHKFLFLLRNPVDRFWSQLNFELRNKKNGIDPLLLIDEKLEKQAYILRSDYKRTIEELLAVTDEKNIFIDFYENIFSDAGNAVIERLSKFLSIEYREDLFNMNKKINVTGYKSQLDDENRIKITNRFKEVYEYVMDRYDVPDNWKCDYNNLLKYES